MNYELAKKLKDAGFPQNKNALEGRDAIHINLDSFEESYIPTLSELIKECGDVCLMIGKDRTVALNATNPMESDKKGSGSIPEEAVALLWLELNKKLSP